MLAYTLFASALAVLAQAAPAAPIAPRARAPALPQYGVAASNGWAAYGCYQDTYPHFVPDTFERTASMTQEYCAAKCKALGKPYMAVEYGSDCYCASQLNRQSNNVRLADSACDMACSGNANQNCGGYYTLVLFANANVGNSASSSASSAASSSASASAPKSSAAGASSSSSSSSSSAPSSSSSAAASSSSSSTGKSSASSSAASSASASASKAVSSSSSAAASSTAASSSSSSVAVSSTPASSAASSSTAKSSAVSSSASSSASSTAAVSSAAPSVAASSAAASSVASSVAATSSVAPSVVASSAAPSVAASSAAASSVAPSVAATSSVAPSVVASSAAPAASSAAPVIDPLAIPTPWVRASNPCIAEATLNNKRALTGASTASDDMTYTRCLDFCSAAGFSIAGIEFGRECFCGNLLTNGASLTKTSDQCTMSCGGSTASSSAICGGPDALTIFVQPAKVASLTADLTGSVVNLPTGWAAASTPCVAEGTNVRALAADSLFSDRMTINTCVSYCNDKGYGYAGIEYGRECYCANTLTTDNTQATGCNMPCAGDATSICGGQNAISLFRNPSLPKVSTPVLPAGWSAASSPCVSEGVSGRALVGASTSGSDMTVPKCLDFCQAKGFQYGALEYGSECYCGSSLVNGASLDKVSKQCNVACAGDASTTCGGPNALQIYVNAANAPAAINGFTAGGCVQEVAGRALTGPSTAGSDMTVARCTSFCSAGGFSIAGLEYGGECYCGNSLVNGASTSLLSGQCNMPCTGGSGICGGPNAINLYIASQ